jgi:putative PIN family toxin of toxin-antitoxin system
MNVVIDTNVWISALISRNGMSRDVIRMALNDMISPQISTSLFLEYETVMKRKKIQTLCLLTQYDAKTRFDLMSSKGNKRRGLELLDRLDAKD